MSEQAPQRQISLCYQNFIVRPTVRLDGFHNKRSKPLSHLSGNICPLPADRWETPHPLSLAEGGEEF